MKKSKLNLSGIIAAISTPFQENAEQSVDYHKLTENVAKWEKIPFAGKQIAEFHFQSNQKYRHFRSYCRILYRWILR